MSDQKQTSNILLNSRRQFTARQSMEALISYARDQDEKIFNRRQRFSYGKGVAVFALMFLPVAYVVKSLTVGYWRKLYSTSILTTPIESVEGNIREGFVPEMYLKEREVRKIQLGLKDTGDLRAIYRKQPTA